MFQNKSGQVRLLVPHISVQSTVMVRSQERDIASGSQDGRRRTPRRKAGTVMYHTHIFVKKRIKYVIEYVSAIFFVHILGL